MTLDLTNDKIYALLWGLFFIGFVWSAIAGYRVGSTMAELVNDGATGIGVGFLVFAAGVMLDFIWIIHVGDARAAQSREEKSA